MGALRCVRGRIATFVAAACKTSRSRHCGICQRVRIPIEILPEGNVRHLRQVAAGYVIPACSYHLVIAVLRVKEAESRVYENDNCCIKELNDSCVLPAHFVAHSTRSRLLCAFPDRSSRYPGTGHVPSKFQRKDRVSRAL